MEEVKTKVCSRCKRELPLTEFSKDKNKKDKLHSTCKQCERQSLIDKHPEKNHIKNSSSDPNIRICKECKTEKSITEFECYKSGDRIKRRLICNECSKEIKNKETKVCVVCGIEKSKSSFNKDPKTPDGLDSRCKECVVEYKKEYYKENKEFVLGQVKKYRCENKDIVKERKQKYNRKNRKYILQWHREYHQRNIKYFNDYSRNYYWENQEECKKRIGKYYKTPAGKATRARSLHKRRRYGNLVENTLTDEQWNIILYDQQHNICSDCENEFDETRIPTKDHILPLSNPWRKGLTFGNTQALCKSCNSSKNNKIYLGRAINEILVNDI